MRTDEVVEREVVVAALGGVGGGRITSAWRVVSLRYRSTLTMNSSVASAASSRSLFGVDSTGLPATVISARTWPSPGVSISSASVATGSSPRDLGQARAPGCASGPVVKPRPPGSPSGAAGARASGNIAPPGRSRLPVSTLSTSTSQLVERAELDRVGADAAVDRGRRRGGQLAGQRRGWSSASTPHTVGDRLGGERPRRALATLVDADDVLGEAAEVDEVLGEQRVDDARTAGRRRCRAGWTGARRRPAAVRVRRGSTTTNRPPRAWIASSRPGKSGAVHRLPLDSHGLAPSISR